MTHADLSRLLIRPPGIPASECPGDLVDIRPDGTVAWPPRPFADAAQSGEGGVGDAVTVRLRRCAECRETVVVATGADGRCRLRNQWREKVDPRRPAAGAGPRDA